MDSSRPIQLCTTMPVIDLHELYLALSKGQEDGPEEVKEIERVVITSAESMVKKMDLGQAIELFDGEKSVFRGRAMDLVISGIEESQREVKHIKVRAGRILIWV